MMAVVDSMPRPSGVGQGWRCPAGSAAECNDALPGAVRAAIRCAQKLAAAKQPNETATNDVTRGRAGRATPVSYRGDALMTAATAHVRSAQLCTRNAVDALELHKLVAITAVRI
jgi:hypothetical protein